MKTDPYTLAEVIDRELRDRGTPVRAEKERAYLKSELVHFGVSVPDTRTVVRETLRAADLDHDAVVKLAGLLWDSTISAEEHGLDFDEQGLGSTDHEGNAAVHERRAAATMVLIQSRDHLSIGDITLIERLLREARTWALVDPLATDLVGPLSEQDDADFAPVLERWALDDDFWIRRSALLAHLRPLREGRGDFDRFTRFADSMLDEREFFIRKAIGWVLRDTARKRPDMAFEWILPRAHRASGVTMREVVKRLSAEQREKLAAQRK